MNILPQNNNTQNKLITTPITPLARSISSGLTMLHDKMKNILEEMIHEITDNLKQRDEDTKYERRFGKKRTGALSNKPTDIEMALDLLSNKFIKKFEHDPHFDIAWGRIAGEKEEEWKTRLEDLLLLNNNNNNDQWPISTAGSSSNISRIGTGGILLTPGLSTRSTNRHRVRWADADRAPPSPYVHARTKSRSSNFRMITSRNMKFRRRPGPTYEK